MRGLPLCAPSIVVKLAGLAMGAAMLCAAAPPAEPSYPVNVAPNRRYLVDRKGTPFLLQGDAAWSVIVGLTPAETEAYLENRRRLGFNTLLVNLIEHKFCKNPPKNIAGEAPFLNPLDFTTPNEKYFAHADWVIRTAGRHGMQVLLAPLYLGYQGTDEGWIGEALINGAEKCRRYGQYLGKRYRDFDNIIWVMGGDRDPGEALPEVNAVARGIREFDTRHLFTAHTAPEHSPSVLYAGQDWLDVNVSYTYGIVHRMMLQEYDRRPVRPYFLIESTYEGEHNASAVQLRRQAYWAILCGAFGQVMGNRPIWNFAPGWKDAIEGTASRDIARLGELFLSRPWYELLPDARHKLVTGGLGEFRGLDYLAAAQTEDRSTAIAYMPSARTITVDLTKISGARAAAWWFNPRDGAVQSAGEFATSGPRDFTPPAPDGDWVLVLDDVAKGRPRPGTAAR